MNRVTSVTELSYDWLLVLPSVSHQTSMLAQHCYRNFPRNLNSKALSALMRFKSVRFLCHRKRIDRFSPDAFSTTHNKTFENDKTAMRML